MAGTRLLIQAIFVAEFFFLALLAVYFGLYKTHDSLSHHLPHYQRGRHLIRQHLSTLPKEADEIFSSPSLLPSRIQIAVSATQQESIRQHLGRDELNGLSVALITVEDEARRNACRAAELGDSIDGSINPSDTEYSIWICPAAESANTSATTPMIRIRNGVIFLSNAQEPGSLLKDLLTSFAPKKSSPLSTHRRRMPLKISLVMEPRRDWDLWTKALSDWITTKNTNEALASWPCLKRGAIATEVVLSTLVEPNKGKKQTKDDASLNNMRLISTDPMKASVVDVLSDKDVWNVMLYVPRESPVSFVDNKSGEQSNIMYVGNTLVTTIDQVEKHIEVVVSPVETENGDDDDANATTSTTDESTTIETPVPIDTLVDHAMTHLNDFLIRQCLGIEGPRQESTGDLLMDSDNSLPLWQIEAWLQHTLLDTHQRATSETHQEGEWLLKASWWVAIDEGVAAHWEILVESIRHARQILQETAAAPDDSHNRPVERIASNLDALSQLEDVLDYLQGLRTDPTLMEPNHFSGPQLLAIFAPLCLPLFLPHFIGLIREWKRYKKLRDKQA